MAQFIRRQMVVSSSRNTLIVVEVGLSGMGKWTDKEFLVEDQQNSLNTGLQSLRAIHINVKGTIVLPALGPGLASDRDGALLDLKNRVTISELVENVNKTLTGKYFLCRNITLPFRMAALLSVFDDPEGKKAVRIGIYKYHATLLPVGRILVIKNPWFKKTIDGRYMVRVDNPDDNIIVIPNDMYPNIFPGLEWKGDLPQNVF